MKPETAFLELEEDQIMVGPDEMNEAERAFLAAAFAANRAGNSAIEKTQKPTARVVKILQINDLKIVCLLEDGTERTIDFASATIRDGQILLKAA